MNELQMAIKKIAYEGRIFPKEALETIVANREEAIPYLRAAIEKAMEKKYELEEDYQVHFYALYLLGEFQDRDFFPRLIDFAVLPSDVLDYLIGDAVTSGFKDILYNTYNGDVELLKNTILNRQVDEYVRSGLLDVMGQLYLDGILNEKEWRTFIKERVHSGEEYSYFYNELADIICRCHFFDMLDEIRFLLDNELMDEMTLGKYDSCVDYMFEYGEDEFCKSPMKTIDILQHWAMFEDDMDPREREQKRKEFQESLRRDAYRKSHAKIGRNDPCFCGSGRKYKHCCMNKPKSPLDTIESAMEREKWLKRYPYTGEERQKGRIYLEDYFDAESIEIDKILYLGLKNRPVLLWLRDVEQEERRSREYLSLAFEMFVKKAEKEEIQDFAEYDQKFSIHYFCGEWIDELLRLLKKDGMERLYAEVKNYYEKMSKSHSSSY